MAFPQPLAFFYGTKLLEENSRSILVVEHSHSGCVWGTLVLTLKWSVPRISSLFVLPPFPEPPVFASYFFLISLFLNLHLIKKLSTEVYSWWALPTACTSITTPTTKITSYIGSKWLWSPQLQCCPDTQGQRTPPYNQEALAHREANHLWGAGCLGYTSQVQWHAQFTLVPQSMSSAADITILCPYKNLSQF